ncbi:hypothetical protein LUZ60_005951 [Juncus effusus]|nr:hypothetical protein LUZ60_005951 [Juncus effusus]
MVGSGRGSSSDEDGDAEWRAAIASVASTPFTAKPTSHGEKSHKTGLKLYQIKAQKVFDEYLEKNLEIVRMEDPIVSDDVESNGGIIKLFKRAPPGITDPQDARFVQNKRPRILPGEEADEKSKKFKRQIRSVSVDGSHIIELAKKQCEKSLERCKEKEALSKEKAKREEERILELKKIRGEMWLPSIAREMKEEARRKYNA